MHENMFKVEDEGEFYIFIYIKLEINNLIYRLSNKRPQELQPLG